MTKEFVLEGLNCAHCAAKIEEKVKKIAGVENASMNFTAKTLAIDLADAGNANRVMEQTVELVAKLEPDVIVKEKTVTKSAQKTLLLIGLDCAHCATKVEHEVRNIDGIVSANVDFVSKKLLFEAAHRGDLTALVSEIQRVVAKIDGDIKVVEDKKEKKIEKREEAVNAFEIARLAFGLILFFTSLLFKFPGVLNVILYAIAYLLTGVDVLIKAVRNCLKGQFLDENFLMFIATIGAFAVKQYPEGVAVMVFYQIGELFQKAAVNHSRHSITALMDIRPDYANRKSGDDIEKVAPEEVSVGERIVIQPGEKVPLDGVITNGSSTLNTAALTGESIPRDVTEGDEILSGSVNQSGVLTVQVTKVYGESTVAKILDMVQNAGARKAHTENFITKFARYYTPAVVGTALLIAFLPPLFIHTATFSNWIYRALIFLVASCPCALVISIPLGFFGGIGAASKAGILVKGSNYLEALNRVETVVFDKTGTLTKGTFAVTQIKSVDSDTSEADLLRFAAFAESYSNHPIALSIVKAYGQTIDKGKITQYEEMSGRGAKAVVDGHIVLAGNAKLMSEMDISLDTAISAGTVIHIAVDGRYIGYLVIADEIKEDAPSAIQKLRKLGVGKIVMLTGDVRETAQRVGSALGVDEIEAELLPGQKVEALARFEDNKSAGGKIIFVGDGINDAPVLVRADIGIAMGGIGSDAAIEAADVVVMTDEPSKVAEAIEIARKTKRIVWQNIIFAFAVKGLVLIFGAGGLATMWEAVFADVGVAVIAIFNAMRVLNGKRQK